MRYMGRLRAWRIAIVPALLLVVFAIPASAAIRLELYAKRYSPTNGRTTYSYDLHVDSASELKVLESTLELYGMAGVLSQGDANNWRNNGTTDTSAHWEYVRAVPFTRHGTFDVIADADKTEPGMIDYELEGPVGKYGRVEGPVAKNAPPTYYISGTVYLDNGGSGGLYDDGADEVLTGVEVQLLDSNDNLVATRTTNTMIFGESGGYIGNYRFGNLPSGDYTVVVPAALSIGDDDLVPTTVTEQSVSVVDAHVREIDFGYEAGMLYSVSGTAFEDLDDDGSWDEATESRLADVGPIQLIDAGDNVIAETTSGSGEILGEGGAYLGNYIFENVPAGSYTVVAPALAGELGSLEITGPTEKSASVVDSIVTGIDFGYVDPSYTQPLHIEVQGYVFFDANRNGQMDDFEMRFDGIEVTLSGGGTGTGTTDGNGFVSLGEYNAGNYNLAVTDGGAYKLLTYWDPTTATSFDFTIDTDTQGPVKKYFGFFYDEATIISDMGTCDITGDNYTVGFWKQNVALALMWLTTGDISRADLLAYLADVEALGPYDDPFELGSNPLSTALWYLDASLSGVCPVQKLDRQLLAAELNWVSGFSSSEPGLERAILWYAEWARNYDQDEAGGLAVFLSEWNNLGSSACGSP